ncbi:6-phosphogluconolactonase [Pseudomonas syringae pv. helianthi]|uniref:6-phosphogluconolactonase n=2 Tax=Pseudomonas syringae group genomosp. 7 TaxID=251699 RepID=A0A3M6CQE9_9PSED|nr:6-phosphogluconolactonase [Pseudomonas syringae pv. helianthi]RMV45989.1 6-phosphogluconolactonase [Pseudomonas syringae pv. helianthi]RMW15336.1 6-phosphogluconolactonase [Pseudomonas syringae pv. tagetis]RMW21581.1 6-phosphogluconolactonase [Pseudomonas syringae pv. tagetis]
MTEIMENPMYAYVGSRTTRERNARGEGISVYAMNQDEGTLELVQVVRDLVNPSFLALNRNADTLYTVHGDQSDVSAFRVDKCSGKLTFLNTQSTQGRNPVHLALDPSERYLVVTNHIGASLAVLPVLDDGSIAPLSQLLEVVGEPGPHRIEQPHAKPHYSLFDNHGRYVIVPDKGLDKVFAFRFSAGRLAATIPGVAARETAGPRHVAFHPKGNLAYVVNELDSTITTYSYDAESGTLSPKQILTTLPQSYTGNSRAAGIQVDREGRFVYASNRGYDSIAVFAVDPVNGLLDFREAAHSGGCTPRFFTLTPNGRYLMALNEDSDSIVTFAVDQDHGTLRTTGFQTSTGSPVCMIFSPSQRC